ncbi:hypothetical protein ONS95_008122 [Cadophora gregata]|uniref:uncharacterized protein n=1 Tax=Cadophora gregata TaxID=51156 RepID=UPI0026DCAB9F|nr:uncharacterized protein ONS95_008122 [Cadophora gregata]KAK0119273.1 hypothetical protein ONS96_012332 [Cadophora gregata f. sp. sojae]KAK0126527.1 hypothetical protein ONS95_008122 [Cadophora gregata]
MTKDAYVVLQREKKLEFGIKGLNAKMGVVGRLTSVGAGYERRDEEGGNEDEDELWELRDLAELEERDRWFWEAAEGDFLRGARKEKDLVQVTTAMEELAMNPWRS